MKNKLSFGSLCLALMAGFALTSCSQDQANGEAGISTLSLHLNAPSGEFATRALNETDYRTLANYTVNISSADDGKVVAGPYKGNELPNTIALPYGSYTVSATCGKEHVASRDEFLSKGEDVVYLGSGEEKSVTINCAPTCGKCVVKFDEEMADYFDDYKVEYSTKAMGAAVVTWNKTDVDPWYLLIDKDGETVKATIRLTAKEAYKVSGEGVIEKTYLLHRNKSWTLNIKPNHPETTGTLGVTITIDESTNDKDIDVVIPAEWIK